MDDVRAAFRAWEAARHAKNVPVCALRQPQLGCQRVSACVPHVFHFSKLFPSTKVWDLYICIFLTVILCIFAVLKNLSNFKCHKKCIEANPCQSSRKCEHYHWRCGKIIWGRIKSWRIPSKIPAPPVTCSIALILSQSDCPQSDSLAVIVTCSIALILSRAEWLPIDEFEMQYKRGAISRFSILDKN